MKTTYLQQEFIEDEFEDLINTASMVLGFECEGATTSGDDNGQYYEISVRITSNTDDLFKTINLCSFNRYLLTNFGEKKDRPYHKTALQAFAALIKAWHIWHNHLSSDVRNEYVQTEVNFQQKLYTTTL